MWKRLVVGALALAALPFQMQGQVDDNRPGLAVMRFTNGGSYGADAQDLAALEVGLQQMLLTELSQNPELRVVDRGIIRDLLDEQDLGTAGRTQGGTAAQVGKLVGARYMITGAFMDSFGQFRIDARIIDVETGEVIQSREIRDARENIYDMLVELASTVMADVQLTPLSTEAREAREARDIPLEAVTIYATAQALEDGGEVRQAEELYRQLVDRFPDMVEAQQALEVVGSH